LFNEIYVNERIAKRKIKSHWI